MSFMYKQISRASKLDNHDPQRITVSQFKFSPQLKSTPSFKVRQLHNPEPTPNTVISHQIPRRGLSFKSDREKKIQRLNSCKRMFLLQQLPVDMKPQTFMNWKQRTKSSKKNYLSNDKLLLQMMRTPTRQFIQRSQSEKKIASPGFDLELRKNKATTSVKIKGKSPMELLTRKLQWRGRDIRRLTPYTSNPKSIRANMMEKGEQKIQKIFLAQMKGWQPNESNQFLPQQALL